MLPSHQVRKLSRAWPKAIQIITLGLLGLISPNLNLTPAKALAPAFSDIEGNWAQPCIEQLAQRQIMGEYSYGLFQPNLPMTRGDYAAMIIEAFPNTPIKRSDQTFNFIDLPQTYWGNAAIREAWLTGFVIGYPGNIFAPFQPISRLEVVLSLMSGLGYLPEIPEIPDQQTENSNLEDQAQRQEQMRILANLQPYFSDASQIPPYARSVILNTINYGLIVNYPNVRLFRPNQPATRAEIAAFLCQALKTTAVVPSQYIVEGE